MPNETTTTALSDSANAINQLGTVGSSGAVTRDRPNQAASVVVTDADNAVYTSRFYGDSWIRGGAQASANHNHTTPDTIIPMPAIGATPLSTVVEPPIDPCG